MDCKAKVSVLIPTCNRPELFEEALNSVLAQTYDHIEIVICDNSTDHETERVVDKYTKTSRFQVRYVKNEKNIGMAANFIKCLELASGEYINYLMDDDLFHPQKIKKMMEHLGSDPEVTLVTSNKEYIDNECKTVGNSITNMFRHDLKIVSLDLGNIVLRHCMNYIGEPTAVLFRKDALQEPFGTYGGKIAKNNSDVATWLCLLKKGKAVYLAECLSYIRIHKNRISVTANSILNEVSDWIDHVFSARQDGYLENQSDYQLCLQNLSKRIMLNFCRIKECIDDPTGANSSYFFSKITEFLAYMKNNQYYEALVNSLFDFYNCSMWDIKLNKLESFLQLKVISPDRQIFIWGAGSGGIKILQILEQYQINAAGFVDSKYDAFKELINGIPVYPPAELRGASVKPFVIIGSMYYEEIRKQLEHYGYISEMDFI